MIYLAHYVMLSVPTSPLTNIMCIPNTTSSHIDFNDWLNQCPLIWFRDELTEEQVTYSFVLPDEDDFDEPDESTGWN